MIVCVPAPSALVEHVAVPPAPRETAAQPIGLPPSVKLTLPVGAFPVTVAVNVTIAPTVAGLAELATEVVEAAAPPPPEMFCVSVLLDDALAASPA